MGRTIEYIGAVQITPMVEAGLAERLALYLEIRHMKRDIPMLETLYPQLEDRKAVTLMADGDFGPDGAFFLPTITHDIDCYLDYSGVEGLTDRFACNMRPSKCPSLYCELKLVAAPDGTCSYLGWTEESSEDVPEWIALIASRLVPAGYHLEGKMFAIVDGGGRFEQITVEDADVKRLNWMPDTTYEEEFQQAWVQEEVYG